MYSTDTTTKQRIYFHQLIGCREYDHIDRNPLNNCRSNLRRCTHSQNMMNVGVKRNNISGVTGVSWDNWASKWRAYIQVNGKSIKLGRFSNKDDAIKARLEAEIKYFKEFAPQKYLFDKYKII